MSGCKAEIRSRSTDKAVLAWLRIARIYHLIEQQSAERFRRHGMSVARFDVLNHAGSAEGKTQQEIAGSLLVTKGNITQLLDAMECEGLLTRQKAGRCNRIFLSDEGRRRRAEMVDEQESALGTAFSSLTDDELSELLRILRKLNRQLEPSVASSATSLYK